MTTALDLAVELAHDVRSPLGAIMALTELVESGASGPVTGAQRRLLRVVRDAADGLAQITTDIVAAGRSHVVDGRETASVFEVPEVLAAVHRIVQPMAEHAGLRVVVTNRGPRQWVGHRTSLTRALLNLTTNALKYTEHGMIEYGARQVSPARLQFFVRDTGGGLERPEPRPAQSVPGWRRADSGLGLVITRQLVGAMGSSLELESSPGEGCCFHFDLPLSDTAGAPAESPSP